PDVYQAQVLDDPPSRVVVFEETRQGGVYRLKTSTGQTVYYVVQPERRTSEAEALGEAPFAPCTDRDRAAVSQNVPVRYEDDGDRLLATLASQASTRELWWWTMLGVVLLLCVEVWFTWRMVRGRS